MTYEVNRSNRQETVFGADSIPDGEEGWYGRISFLFSNEMIEKNPAALVLLPKLHEKNHTFGIEEKGRNPVISSQVITHKFVSALRPQT